MVKMKEQSFEEALKKIEEITSSLEEEDLPLKEKIEKFKEGAELLKFCNKELKEAEMSIQKIVDKDGKIKLEEFE
jgi:exodeoxyribonuclease VII small subunit